MELTSTIVNAVVVTAVGAILAWLGKGRFDALERRLDRHEAQNEARFEAIDRRFEAIDRRFEAIDHRFEAVQASMDGLRSDVTQIALALGTRPGAQNA